MNKTQLALFQYIQHIREYFCEKGYLDIPAPVLVPHPGIEVHIHPLKVQGANPKSIFNTAYLHTSPEFYMKHLLAQNKELEKIFTLSFSFRDDIKSDHHREQFLMLEWYRVHAQLEELLEETQIFIKKMYEYGQQFKLQNTFAHVDELNLEIVTMNELFLHFTKISILDFENFEDLYQLIKKDFKSIPLPDNKDLLAWDDLFFLLFLNCIDPHIRHYKALAITSWPKELAALAVLDPKDTRVAKRFEIYLYGLEICNCFEELIDLDEQKLRAKMAIMDKKKFYNYELGEPKILFDALSLGLPPTSGNALGVERLFNALWSKNNTYISKG